MSPVTEATLLNPNLAEHEWCYLLLLDTPILFNGDPTTTPLHERLRVNVMYDGDDAINNHDDDHVCTGCSLLLTESASQGFHFSLSLNSMREFHGHLNSDMHCRSCSGRPRRSDASLIMALLWTCRHLVIIRDMSLWFTQQKREHASIAIALDFPGLDIYAAYPRLDSSKRHSKPLHVAMQLLLSIVRSDWEHLESIQRALEDPCHSFKSDRVSFFPLSMSLGEVYERIQPSPIETLDDRRTDRMEQSSHNFLNLPKEILLEKVAPLLRAPDLDALRNTCVRFHTMLRAVVPGLKLKLYQHQIRSLCWMREREARCLSERDCLEISNTAAECVEGDYHRAATGGHTVLLRERRSGAAVRLDQYFGHKIQEEAFLNVPRSVGRGGLLCDDPGLGKTITVLSLILQTAGLSTEREPEETRAGRSVDEPIFHAYWHDSTVPDTRRPALLQLANKVIKSLNTCNFVHFTSLRKDVDKDAFGSDFAAFEQAVMNSVVQTDSSKLYIAKDVVNQFKCNQLRSAKKAFSSAVAKPNSRVADLVEKQAQNRLLKSLIPTSGSLLVVPGVLIEHWKAQIEMHIDMSYLTRKTPIIYEFKGRASIRSPDEVRRLCNVEKTHAPILFIDLGGTSPLPAAEFLAMFRIVLIPSSRFMHEYKNGSFREELRKGDKERTTQSDDYLPMNEAAACSVLKVHWLRMVVDEGHHMAQGRLNATIQFASWVSAERLWAMTGTPTKQNASQINQFRGLTQFLHHDFFSSRHDGEKVWKTYIADHWRSDDLVAFFRLRSSLALLMKRHTKRDIVELPPPILNVASIPMSHIETATYNTLVVGIQSNILITSMKGTTSGMQDSLLHRSQAKHAKVALANLRRVSVGFARVGLSLDEKHFVETLVLADHLPACARDRIRNFLVNVEEGIMSSCMCCTLQLSTLLITHCCGGLICPECMDSTYSSCVLCDKEFEEASREFDVDDFQRLQPGFNINWKNNIEKKSQSRGKNNTIEGETSLHPVNENIIVRPQVEPRRRSNHLGDGHECCFDVFSIDGRCTKCMEEHNACDFLTADKRCRVCYRLGEDCPEDETKASYLVHKLFTLYHEQPSSFAPSTNFPAGQKPPDRPLKAIIFSQFREALNVIGDRLYRRFGAARVAEYWGKVRSEELQKFIHSKECFCMLLSRDGSEGLDLSFVTHIFFLEEIWDKALEEQAIARAWRMGASGVVHVETLIAEKSVEELMRNVDTDTDNDFDLTFEFKTSESDQQKLKTARLLKSLRLITDSLHFSNPESDIDTDASLHGLKRKWATSYDPHNSPTIKHARVVRFA